ncbi:MAG: heavy metal translocating P-type ATPase metal-binding domain-containing protein [Bacteroidetes bacterium]|nr:heavy metal translocating P-type ATPase metal-binding domain-containing protein [Bacteroidota bacterium]
MSESSISAAVILHCFHCGDEIRSDDIIHDKKHFCCNGCKTVYEILEQNNLCRYYNIEQMPGISPPELIASRFDYLDDNTIQHKLFKFYDESYASVQFIVPSIHCSSCLWLLENLHKIDRGIISSRVEFLKKSIVVNFHPQKTTLKNIVVLLTSLGYEPELQLDAIEQKVASEQTRSLYYKIGIAGFCFGNAMLFSFPEYLGAAKDGTLQRLLSFLNLGLSLPVFFYSGFGFFQSAYAGVKKKIVNIDVPVSLGIFILFVRSAYEILTQTGAGFVDSLTGLVFFLLLGKLFQSKTYDRLNFERNYKSYFPIAVTVKKNGMQTTIPVTTLRQGDKLLIHNNEIIPADALLLGGDAAIDYSFVTGESKPVEKVLGELVYAGGRQKGGMIELEVVKEVSQSYLMQLWNNINHSAKEKGELETLSNTVSKYFTVVILAVAFAAALYWMRIDVATALNAFTGILIIACPCALAISTPFTMGTTMRIFAKNNFFLKNASIVESLAKITKIVFDKTGTITLANNSEIDFIGAELSSEEYSAIKGLTNNSLHPMSRAIFASIELPLQSRDSFTEIIGKGIQGMVAGMEYKIGSAKFLGIHKAQESLESRVYVSCNGNVKGYFKISGKYRNNLSVIIQKLSTHYTFSILSGDSSAEQTILKRYFPESTAMLFNKKPDEKLKYIQEEQQKNENVLMLGDGLNDAGALLQSNIGVAVTEDIAHFTPSSDAILTGEAFHRLPEFLHAARSSRKIVIASFIFSFLYNIFGLYFAVQGILSPVVAAILMPLSSITIVIFTTTAAKYFAKRKGLL